MRISDWSSDVCSSDLHQDFAMRHVDDAHQPEAQREPHGGENVDRRDAEAVEDLSDEESGVHMVRPVQALSPPGSGRDRTSVVEGTSVSVRVDLGGRRIIKKKKTKNKSNHDKTK